jgi:hypothetical protein
MFLYITFNEIDLLTKHPFVFKALKAILIAIIFITTIILIKFVLFSIFKELSNIFKYLYEVFCNPSNNDDNNNNTSGNGSGNPNGPDGNDPDPFIDESPEERKKRRQREASKR